MKFEWDPKLSTDVIHSPGIASCIYSQNLSPLLTWNFLSTLRDGQECAFVCKVWISFPCHLEESPLTYFLQAKADLGSSKSGWNQNLSTACCFLRKQHFALPHLCWVPEKTARSFSFVLILNRDGRDLPLIKLHRVPFLRTQIVEFVFTFFIKLILLFNLS